MKSCDCPEVRTITRDHIWDTLSMVHDNVGIYCCPVGLLHDRDYMVFIPYSMKLTHINAHTRAFIWHNATNFTHYKKTSPFLQNESNLLYLCQILNCVIYTGQQYLFIPNSR